ncbi:MAG: hypothetical protein PHX38_00705 [Sulfuricella sp.]|nr:hypothetical protein [Sulfuricella sp.]
MTAFPRRRAAALYKTWRALPERTRNARAAALAAALAALYFALLWPVAHKRIAKMEYDLGKQAVREKSASRQDTAPAKPPASLAGKSVAEAKKELEALHLKLEETRAEIGRLDAAFVSLDDTLALNALKSGLTSLAEAGDMEVQALEHVYSRPEDKDSVPTPQLMRDAAGSNPFKRPLIVFRARASYRGLMQFLDGLAALPYIAAPVWSDITVKMERNPETQAPAKQWLEIVIKLAV